MSDKAKKNNNSDITWEYCGNSVGIKVNQQYMIFGLMINHEILGVPFIFSDKHTQNKKNSGSLLKCWDPKKPTLKCNQKHDVDGETTIKSNRLIGCCSTNREFYRLHKLGFWPLKHDDLPHASIGFDLEFLPPLLINIGGLSYGSRKIAPKNNGIIFEQWRTVTQRSAIYIYIHIYNMYIFM